MKQQALLKDLNMAYDGLYILKALMKGNTQGLSRKTLWFLVTCSKTLTAMIGIVFQTETHDSVGPANP